MFLEINIFTRKYLFILILLTLYIILWLLIQNCWSFFQLQKILFLFFSVILPFFLFSLLSCLFLSVMHPESLFLLSLTFSNDFHSFFLLLYILEYILSLFLRSIIQFSVLPYIFTPFGLFWFQKLFFKLFSQELNVFLNKKRAVSLW